jgi:sialic acid synthase SpsE
MVSAIRDVSAAMGDGGKICRPEERNTREIARRSIVAGATIAKGTIFTKANLICKRPGPNQSRLSPNQLWEVLGKAAKHDYAADDFINIDELKS